MPRGKTHLVKGPCNNKQKVLHFPRFEGFISVEGGGLEGERKWLGWSLQNTPSSSPCLAKCCLQQFGPHHQPSFQSHRPPAPPQDLNYSSDFWPRCVSKAAPFCPSMGFAKWCVWTKSTGPFSLCSEGPWAVLTPVLCPSRSLPAGLAWEPPAGTISKARYGSRAWEAAADVNHAICARDGALHLLCEAVPAYLACCVCLSHLLTASPFHAVGWKGTDFVAGLCQALNLCWWRNL